MNNAFTLATNDEPVEAMSLTADLVALCYREIVEPESDPAMVRFEEPDFDRAASDVLERLGSGPIWVFAYGSLIWKPAADVAETRLSTAFGWHRAFCLEMQRWRGTPEQPGLMMALRKGGECTGIAQRIEDDDRHQTMVKLLRREIGGPMGYAALRLIDLHSEQGPLRTLCFYADPPEVADVPELPISRVAAVLARACGHAGSCAEYLFKTVCALESASIRDAYLWNLQAQVAKEIKRLHFGVSHSHQAGSACDAG
ncbi:gamma-glutamylcyclotransferase [Ruegeria sp. WL0004]|uniref:glutathione-specific gamma-glutamylcyclotransferase n=1 Tax=Ruegeria marisflavi TaxID=2984152 RepID=A0ABT2WWU4_9RHOB|nr:gamma-glutamylcyclotransferase [Ruegeria sp. WL0004]MCU9840360.1 gamma-glutamylcyclotransferase [Ruegeria sp. WL0004]